MEKVALVRVLVQRCSRGCFVGRCAARPAVRGGAPSLSSVAELVGGCVTTGGSRRRACPTSAGTRCDGRRRLPLQPLLQRPSLPVHGLDPIPQRVVPSGGAAREAAAGTLGSISGFPSVAPESTDLADVLGFNFTDVLAPAEGLHGADHAVRARYSDFAICSCGGISQICQWYRVCDAGALRAEPLATLYILRGQNVR